MPVADDAPDKLVRRVTRRIAEVRRTKGLTQAEMALRLGMAEKNYQRIERGQNVTVHTLGRIARALGVPASEFFER